MTTLLGVDLRGRRVLLAGGGPVAARRATALLADGVVLRVVAPELCEDLADLVTLGSTGSIGSSGRVGSTGRVEWCPRPVTEADLDDVWLVHAATGDHAVDEAVAEWAAARRVWCVVAARVDRGTARTPATALVGDVRLGVLSAGEPDPGRSRAVVTALVAALHEGRVDLRRHRPGPGRVVLVGGGPGDPGLLTLRGRRALAEADVVVTDRLGPTAVLADLLPDVEVVHVGKAPGHHPVPQEEINRILVERAARGQVVVRLKGGDPFVYGRGGEEVLACRAAGVEVTVVPGVSSALAAPVAAGIPLTHRGTTGAVQVVNGHDGLGSAAQLALRERSATVVVLMGVESLPRLVEEALTAGAAPDLPVAVVEAATTDRQRVTRACLADVVARARATGVRAPAVIVLGDVARPDLLEPA